MRVIQFTRAKIKLFDGNLKKEKKNEFFLFDFSFF